MVFFYTPWIHHRSTRPEVFCRKGGLKNFTKFTKIHLCQSLFFNKVPGLGQLEARPKPGWGQALASSAKWLSVRLWVSLQSLETWNLIKKETLTEVFFWEFKKKFKNTFFMQHLPWLLLTWEKRLSDIIGRIEKSQWHEMGQ